jgi:ribonuclease HI
MIQEWEVAQRSIRNSLDNEQALWMAFSKCGYIEVYTDGSAPIRNPGGPCGFAAVVLGFDHEIDESKPERPQPVARLDLGGYIEKRTIEPKTSNNRAEIAGLLAAYEALCQLSRLGCAARQITVWTDSQYAMNCANGTWQRKKNTDLWPILDRLTLQQPKATMKWIRGHSGNPFNESADELATKAAFNFDEQQYLRYRAAQQATGQEMPDQTSPKVASDKIVDVAQLIGNADYMLALYTHVVAGGHPNLGPRKGDYRLWTKAGKNRTYSLDSPERQGNDEADYSTLIHALTYIADRITNAGRDTSSYRLIIYSRQELMIKQLRGEYKVKAPALQDAYAQASALFKQFKSAELIYRDANFIKQLMQA